MVSKLILFGKNMLPTLYEKKLGLFCCSCTTSVVQFLVQNKGSFPASPSAWKKVTPSGAQKVFSQHEASSKVFILPKIFILPQFCENLQNHIREVHYPRNSYFHQHRRVILQISNRRRSHQRPRRRT